VIKLLRQC